MANEATVQVIKDIKPIEGADKIEVATIKGWQVVIKKGQFKVGDYVIYVQPDSLLPIKPEYEFLKDIKKMDNGKQGYRLRTVKLRGQISQGLILLLSSLDNEQHCAKFFKNSIYNDVGDTRDFWALATPEETIDLMLEEGIDVSIFLDIVHYEKSLPGHLSGVAKGLFPNFLIKTDEERIQNIPELLEVLRGKPYYITEKLDGTSFTAYYMKGTLGVCSRNLELKDTEHNIYWKMARKYKLEEIFKKYKEETGDDLAIQGELCG